MSDDKMQGVARRYGQESAFVVDPSGTGCDLALRFWVPSHEMSMCGHATLGAVWLLAQLGRGPGEADLQVHTLSGVVRARVSADGVRIDQPPGRIEALADDAADAVVAVLGLDRDDLADGRLRNATTSRTKTLVPVRAVAVLDRLTPVLDGVADVCAAVGSTGLYPYAPSGERRFDARQFPRSSGYPEDAATGIAAAALSFGLLADKTIELADEPIVVRQGRAMGRPSKITVEHETVLHADGSRGVERCWITGAAFLTTT